MLLSAMPRRAHTTCDGVAVASVRGCNKGISLRRNRYEIQNDLLDVYRNGGGAGRNYIAGAELAISAAIQKRSPNDRIHRRQPCPLSHNIRER
jgi:hypothetical protein